SYAAGKLSLEHAFSCWRSRRATPAGEIYFSFRSSSRAGNSPTGMAVEALDARGTRLWGDFCFPFAGVYLLLREIYVLERRLCLGRPLCFDCRGTGDTRCCAAAHA